MADPLAGAVAALGRGALVVYPTDTLYGLGARAADAAAVDRLIAVKRRPEGMPISVTVSSTEEIELLAELSEAARGYLRTALPGPFTVIVRLRENARIAPALRAADGSLGVRVPDHPIARELARRAGPLTATSANRHGTPTGATWTAVRAALRSDVTVYVTGGPAPSGSPSTLVDLRGAAPTPVARRPAGVRP
jgi:L-threonylcarbamoyladenylate synthase